MDEKQFDRRPDEKPAEPGAGKHAPTRPKPGRKAPEVPEGNKGFRKPEGHPIDKPTPKTGPRVGGKDIFEGERSDRESGRPVQLEDDNQFEDEGAETTQPGRADAEPGLGGRQQAGHQDWRSREGEPTKR